VSKGELQRGVMNGSGIREQMLCALRNADAFLSLSDVFGLPIYQLGQELVQSLADDGCVPYVIGESSRYRSSPLATCLLSLWEANLLSTDTAEIMRQRLFDFRDSMPPYETRKPRRKNREDSDAWCVSEGASVWSTSMALLALVKTRTRRNQTQDCMLAQGSRWLVRQQDTNSTGGWGFQMTVNSKPTVPMTALALRALAAALQLPDIEGSLRNDILASLQSGYNFLRRELKTRAREAYWTFDDQPSLTATVWSLQALSASPLGPIADLPHADILRFCLSRIPDAGKEWKSECFLKEPMTKYAHQKTFYTFMPSLIPPLLEAGVSPFERKIVHVLEQFVAEGRDRWVIEEYNRNPCTFTHAMALHTLVKWCVIMQKTVANGFFPIQADQKRWPKCPVSATDPSKCAERIRLRTMSWSMPLMSVVLAVFLVALCAQNPSIWTEIVGALKWITTTIIGGCIATWIGTLLWDWHKGRSTKKL